MGRSAVRRSGPKHDFRQRLTLPNGRTVQARFTRDPCATHKYISISMRTCQGPRTRAPSAHGAGQALPQRSTLNALPSVVAIVGPTASGKTDTALAIARRFGGEIIVADSRQVYRGMDIGTNKAHGTWTMKHEAYLVEGIPYYGIDLVEPDETFTVQQWKKFAVAAIDAIVARKHLPVIEGGTGLYVTSLLDNWDIPEIAPDNTLRTLAENRIAQEGIEPIVKEILEVLKRPELTSKFHTLKKMDFNKILKILSHAQAVEIPNVPNVSRDPKDNIFIATVIEAEIDFLFS